MTRSRKILAALGMLLVLVLAGCVRFQADLRLNPDDTVNGDDHRGGGHRRRRRSRAMRPRQAPTASRRRSCPNLRGADGVTASDYDQDEYIGTKFDMSNTPIDAFSGGGEDGALTLTREGSEFAFSGTLDFTPDDGETEVGPDDDTSNISVSVTFPGAVTEHNGELEGTTVTWSGTIESKIDMEARGSAVSTGPPAWLWLVAGIATLLIVLAIVFVAIRSRRTSASPPATPAG